MLILYSHDPSGCMHNPHKSFLFSSDFLAATHADYQRHLVGRGAGFLCQLLRGLVGPDWLALRSAVCPSNCSNANSSYHFIRESLIRPVVAASGLIICTNAVSIAFFLNFLWLHFQPLAFDRFSPRRVER